MIIGVGDNGVWTALGNGDATFQKPKFVLENFGYDQGWRVDRHPRMLATFARSGPAGIIGFGDCGVWTALSDGAGGFAPPQVVVPDFG